MKYIAVACEGREYDHKKEVLQWLSETFQRVDEDGKSLWYRDYQPMTEDLCMREDVYQVYCLRWV